MTENGPATHDVAMGGSGSLVLFLLISVWVKGIASDTLVRVGSEINCNIFLDINHLSVTMKLKKVALSESAVCMSVFLPLFRTYDDQCRFRSLVHLSEMTDISK